MNTAEVKRPLFMTGIVYIDKWNKKGDITGLSLIASSGKEYLVCPNAAAVSLSNYVWDEVEVEFYFVNGYGDEPWIDVIHFNPKYQSSSSLTNQVFDGVHQDLDDDRSEWQFDVDTFVDQFEKLGVA